MADSITQQHESLAPLAHRARPRTFDELVGQRHLLGPGGIIRRFFEAGQLPSMIFWGGPGCGKTTLAMVLARSVGADFYHLSAVTAGVGDIKKISAQARENLQEGRKTVLFLDEIHRFNRAQQDILLGPVEEGVLILLGATTENPSFSVITPLLSRSRVIVLKPLTDDDLETVLQRGLALLATEADYSLVVADDVLPTLAAYAQGDARRALNLLETVVLHRESRDQAITWDEVQPFLADRYLTYDKSGEEHYNHISAFIKSMRAGDPDAVLYWLGRMLEAGEDPLYCARRMIRFASEDIGNAAPQALQMAINARQAYEVLGSPEGELSLMQAAVYLAVSPKSDAIYLAVKRVRREIEQTGSLPVPLQVRNAPTKLMKKLDYGKGYVNPHRAAESGGPLLECLPEGLRERHFYRPGRQGFEETITARLQERLARKKAR
ncbi:MAG: replication-associated recombination protein A [Deltaproteobacteria bacterium]|nr:replication-associated recombination protein A [Candidatus Anaeroferrophillus wilburensis]MBN2888382.1 replication-associated recombination protein A [Deltaproteobacteria bacterium]